MFKKLLKITGLFVTCIAFMFYMWIIPVHAFSPSSSETFSGIDVSVYQGSVDYYSVKSAGIKIIYIKSSEGTTLIDPYFERNYTNAKANGLCVGVYHYVRARTVEQARNEAQFFASVISGKQLDCMPAMDFESFGNLTKYEVNQIGITFLNTVKELTGKQPVIYSNSYTAKYIFDGEVTKFPLWVAQYGVNYPESNGNWDTWVGWQYTDKGIISGINGYVDRDTYTKEIFLSDSSPVPDNNPPDTNPNINGTTIVIRYGDTLSELAIKYNTTVATLVELNNISNPNLIYAGHTLIVPSLSGNENTNGDSDIYIVRQGDTLWGIAKKFNTTVNALVSANNIQNRNLIYIGQRIVIPRNNALGYITYKIQYGDTLWGIARKFNTTISHLVNLNNIRNPNLIYAGTIIKI